MGAGGAGDCYHATVMTPRGNAVGMFRYNNRSDFGGVYYVNEANSSRIAFFGIPVEAIGGAAGSATRDTLFQHIFNFFDATSSTPEPTVSNLPSEYKLSEAFPNPFNPSTVVGLAIPAVSNVRVVLYDVGGREIGVVFNGKLTAGEHRLTVNLTGRTSGVYLLKAQSGSWSSTRKLVLMK